MLFERAAGARDASSTPRPGTSPVLPEPPLTCMMYFFASQMSQNAQSAPSPAEQRDPSPMHPLDALLTKVSVHAAFSPLVTQFETFPVEIPQPPGRKAKVPRELNHDTMLLVKFRSKRAREEWIATREWREFMEKTDSQGVFRRMPYVRCAGSLRSLSDPPEVLGF